VRGFERLAKAREIAGVLEGWIDEHEAAPLLGRHIGLKRGPAVDRQRLAAPVAVQTPRERGRHILHRYADGLEKCVGCELCAIACPVGCIVVEAAENTPEHRVSPGERYAKRYEINLLRCIYCGMCEEACPYDAITMGPRYDLADDHPDKFIAVKEDMLEPLSASLSDTARPSGAPSAQPVPRKW